MPASNTIQILLIQSKEGDVLAQHSLGIMYLQGLLGTEIDKAAALFQLRLAALQKHSDAQCDLGWLLPGEGLNWFKLAAAQNHPRALSAMQSEHFQAQGIKSKDKIAQCKLLSEKGDKYAQYELATLLKGEDNVIAAAQYQLAAEQGYACAQYELAQMLLSGEGVAKDETTAIQWLKKASEQGHMYAQHELAKIFKMQKNYVESIKQFQLAAAQGHVLSQYELGPCLPTASIWIRMRQLRLITLGTLQLKEM